MGLTLQLTPQETVRLTRHAQRQGIPAEQMAQQLLTAALAQEESPTEPSADPTLALFAQWKAEDANLSPEEREAERKLWEDFEAGVNATRQALGMQTL